MAGLVPAIHAVPPSRALNLWPIGMSKTTELSPSGAAWMAGTSPAMTAMGRFGQRRRPPGFGVTFPLKMP